ncbi:MAG: hypothetical protein DRO12_03570 [Thermoprotei archaeon]|nr:MAG: hypothetical protein DRO12_03570 [Thermoprotei archaeon]
MASDVEKILDALGHRIRRAIVRALGSRGPMTYTELMRAVGVEDSGTFAFHLKKLQGLVRKNERGEYELTELGRRAYAFLKLLEGESEAVERLAERSKEILVVEDKLEFVFGRNLAEKLRKEGRKIRFRKIVRLVVEDMPPELLRSVVEGVEKVLVIEAPEELHGILAELARDTLIIRGRSRVGRQGMFRPLLRLVELGPAIAGVVVDTVSRTIPKILEVSTSMFLTPEHKETTIEIPRNIKGINLVLASSSLKIRSGDTPQIKIRFREHGEYSVDVEEDNTLVASFNGVFAEVILPRYKLKKLHGRFEASSAELQDVDVENLEVVLDSSVASLKRVVVSNDIKFSTESSMLRGSLQITPGENSSSLSLDSTSSSVGLGVKIPREVPVKLSASTADSSLVSISIDGKEVGVNYEEEKWRECKRRFSMMITTDSSVVRIEVEKSS